MIGPPIWILWVSTPKVFRLVCIIRMIKPPGSSICNVSAFRVCNHQVERLRRLFLQEFELFLTHTTTLLGCGIAARLSHRQNTYAAAFAL